jgi:hypothetical protein
VRQAEQLVEQGVGDPAATHHILAIALSQQGRFEEAALTEERALALLGPDQSAFTPEYRRTLERYRGGEPYRAER